MKTRIRIILIIIILTMHSPLCFASSTVENKTNKNKIILEDDAQLFTTEQEKMLTQIMNNLAEYGNIAVKTTKVNNKSSTANYAESYYRSVFQKNSGTVFIIDMAKRNIYIFSDGENYRIINTSKANTIADNIYLYATKGQYYECAKQGLTQMQILLQGGQVPEPMKYTSNILIALMLALLISFIVFRKTTRNKEVKIKELIEDNDNIFKYTEPIIKQIGQHKVYSPESSDGDFGGDFGGGGDSRTEAAEAAEVIASK